MSTVFINCDRQTIADPAGHSADKPTTPAAITASGSSVKTGALYGVRATCAASCGNLTIKVWRDQSKTDQIYSVVLDLSASPFMASDILATPIPFFETPHVQINNSADPHQPIYLTFYVEKIALAY